MPNTRPRRKRPRIRETCVLAEKISRRSIHLCFCAEQLSNTYDCYAE